MIRVFEGAVSGPEWDAFVRSAPDATVMHLFGWKAVMERAYGLSTHYLAAFAEDGLCGVLPLALVKSPFLGASLTSMPFMDYGGVCAGGHAAAEKALVEAAREIARQERARLVLRYLRKPEVELPCSLAKVTMFLDLGMDEAELWRRLPSERRNRIRKSQKSGLRASFHRAEGLRDFYHVFATNMRDLGSPVHSLRFFTEVMSALGDGARIVLVRDRKQPVGAGLMLLRGGVISMPWVSSLRPFFHACPSQALYWETMRFGIAQGFRVLDLGRSSRGSGTFEAKRQWGATPVQLYWVHEGEDAAAAEVSLAGLRRKLLPAANGWLQAGELGWLAHVWQQLPVGVANAVGPWLRRGIPN